MATRQRYLLMYDIRSPARLKRIHDLVADHGERLQYSVYICDLTRQELVRFRARLRSLMHLDEDSVSIFDLGPATPGRIARVEHLGHREDAARDRPADDPGVVW